MSEAVDFGDSVCPTEDQPFLFDFSVDLNEINDDIATITDIDVDTPASDAGFETHSDVITDVNGKDPKTGKPLLTEKGGVIVWFKINVAKQSDVYWNKPGNRVTISVLVTTTGGIKMVLAGLLTVSQPV